MASRRNTNAKVRTCLDDHEMKQWQLAEQFRVYENTLSRWLRHELPEEIQDLLCDVIEGDLSPIPELKDWFRKRALAGDEQLLNNNIETVIKEVSEREFEAELEKDREREEWLFEERIRRNEH